MVMLEIESVEPPCDPEQQAIIDKLAQFVARNGPDFEQMTKEKQQGNPQFAFLSGGEYSEYYKNKVEELKKSMSNIPPQPILSQRQNLHSDSSVASCQWSGSPLNRNWDDQCPGVSGDCWSGGPWPVPQGNWGPSWGSPSGPPIPWGPGNYPPNYYPPALPPPHHPNLNEEDIKRSEANLNAQYEKIILLEKPAAIQQCLDTAREENLIANAAKLNVPVDDILGAIQPLIDLCTKENIARGKIWVVEQMSKSKQHASLVADYLIMRVLKSGATFETRLHIVYLLNDLLHYLKRHSGLAFFQEAINQIVVPIFCLAIESADETQQAKLLRVLSIWESNAYLTGDLLQNMKNQSHRVDFITKWRTAQDQVYADNVAVVEDEHTRRYESLKTQHDEFADHVRKAMAAGEDHQTSESDAGTPFPGFSRYAPPPPPHPYNAGGAAAGGGVGGGVGGGGGGGGAGWGSGNFDHRWHNAYDGSRPPPFLGGPPPIGVRNDRWGRQRGDGMAFYHPDEEYCESRRGHPPPPPYRGAAPHPRDRFRREAPPSRFDDHIRDERAYRGAPPYRRRYADDHESDYGGDREVSDRWNSEPRRPRGGLSPGSESPSRSSWTQSDATSEDGPHQVPEEDLIPKVPFWQLPAALMYPLIQMKDFDFTPIDPSKLRLLPPEPPSESIMLALDAYYAQPTHDRPRDAEGWERLGLFEFYRAKEEAKSRNADGEDNSSTDNPPTILKKNSNYKGPSQLSYLTAYPKSAIGQAIRTGPAALIGVPPPTMLLPKMNAQFAAAAAAAASASSASTANDCTTGVPPKERFPPTGFMNFPPPGLLPQASTQPPAQLITRTRLNSIPRRRSKSRSPTYSRSQSASSSSSTRSRESQHSSSSSRSRGSHSRSSRSSRSRSPPSDRRWRDRSDSPHRGDGDESVTTAGFMHRPGGPGKPRDGRNMRGGPGGYSGPPQWGFDQGIPLPPPPMMSPFDRGAMAGHPPLPPQMYPGGANYPSYRGGSGAGFRGNGYGGPPPPLHGGGQRNAGPYYRGGVPLRRGGGSGVGGGYQGR